MKGIHGEKKPHKCSICDYVTAQKRNLEEHINLVHEERKPTNNIIKFSEVRKKRDQNRDGDQDTWVVQNNKRQKITKSVIKKHGGQFSNQKVEKEINKNGRRKLSRQSIRRKYIKVINILVQGVS